MKPLTPQAWLALVLEYLKVDKAGLDRMASDFGTLERTAWRQEQPRDASGLGNYYRALGGHYLANQVAFALDTWDSHCPPIPDGVRSILDYGCGSGVSALSAVTRGVHEVHLLDWPTVGRNFAVWCLERYGVRPVVHDPPALRPEFPAVDMITCIEVIEHLVNPLEVLHAFSSRCRYLWVSHLIIDPAAEAADTTPSHLKLLPPPSVVVPYMRLLGFEHVAPLMWRRVA